MRVYHWGTVVPPLVHHASLSTRPVGYTYHKAYGD